MAVTSADVKRVAKLAKLSFTEKETQEISADMEKIFQWIDQLNEAHADAVSPLVSVSVDQMPQRADEIKSGGHPESIFKNAPDAKFNMFVVPKVVE